MVDARFVDQSVPRRPHVEKGLLIHDELDAQRDGLGLRAHMFRQD